MFKCDERRTIADRVPGFRAQLQVLEMSFPLMTTIFSHLNISSDGQKFAGNLRTRIANQQQTEQCLYDDVGRQMREFLIC